MDIQEISKDMEELPKKNNNGWGGAREGGGRPSKSDEQKMIEKLSPMENQALEALQKQVALGEAWAIQLFFKYYYGLPKIHIDHTSDGEPIILNFLKEADDDNTIDITPEDED